MNIFDRLTITNRLILLVAAALVGMTTLGAMGLKGMSDVERSLISVYDDRLVPTGQISEIIGLMRDNRTQLYQALQHNPATAYARLHDHPIGLHTERVIRNIERISEVWKAYMGTDLTQEEKRIADEFARTRRIFVEDGLRPAVAALTAGEFERANLILIQQVNPSFEPANAAAEKLFALQLEVAEQLYRDAQAEHALIRNIDIALIAAGIGLLAGMAWYTIRGIQRAVTALDGAASRMSRGDLTARADYRGGDELGRVASAFNAMGERFQTLIGEVASATARLATAAEETSTVTEQTTAGLRAQQSEIEQVATAMNEMNATVHEVAQNAGLAASSAHQADEAAANGRRVVTQTIEVIDGLAHEVERAAEAIHALEQESENIGTVLDVIRGIAEQTNLLALNAAIEAARAGEQGRGFAVVADEVRSLAQRTQQSTREIQEMIERLQKGAGGAVTVMESGRKQAQEGVRQAAVAGGALDTIAEAVARINDMNAQIASAAEQQSAVAEDINRNITSINEVSDQTGEGAVQTANASQEVARLAEQLRGLVSQFRT